MLWGKASLSSTDVLYQYTDLCGLSFLHPYGRCFLPRDAHESDPQPGSQLNTLVMACQNNPGGSSLLLINMNTLKDKFSDMIPKKKGHSTCLTSQNPRYLEMLKKTINLIFTINSEKYQVTDVLLFLIFSPYNYCAFISSFPNLDERSQFKSFRHLRLNVWNIWNWHNTTSAVLKIHQQINALLSLYIYKTYSKTLFFACGQSTLKYVWSCVTSSPGRCLVLYFILECWESLEFHLYLLVHKCWETVILKLHSTPTHNLIALLIAKSGKCLQAELCWRCVLWKRPMQQRQLSGLTWHLYPEKLLVVGHISAAASHCAHSSNQACNQMLWLEVILKVFIFEFGFKEKSAEIALSLDGDWVLRAKLHHFLPI